MAGRVDKRGHGQAGRRTARAMGKQIHERRCRTHIQMPLATFPLPSLGNIQTPGHEPTYCMVVWKIGVAGFNEVLSSLQLRFLPRVASLTPPGCLVVGCFRLKNF